jgi:hypothetical protein
MYHVLEEEEEEEPLGEKEYMASQPRFITRPLVTPTVGISYADMIRKAPPPPPPTPCCSPVVVKRPVVVNWADADSDSDTE